MDISAELVPLFRKELELCKVKEGDLIVLFTEPRFEQPYPPAFMGAAGELGAEVFELVIPAMRTGISDSATKMLELADLVIDMTLVRGGEPYWRYSESLIEVLASGTRTLMVFQAAETLRRLFPDPAVAKRARAGAEFLEDAKVIRVKSPAGTDLTCSKEGRIAGFQQGFSDEPGRWDHWPGAQVNCAPLESSAEGRIVLDVGDWIINADRMVTRPIEITVSKGRITKIGGGPETLAIEEYFQSHDSDSRGLSHIGWGCEHRAIWGASIKDTESYYANCLVAFGSNFFRTGARNCGLGGENHSNGHLDIGMRNTDFYVDDVLVTHNGKIVYEKVK